MFPCIIFYHIVSNYKEIVLTIAESYSKFFDDRNSSDDSDSPEQTFSVEIHCTPELYVLRSAARDSHNKLSAHETRTCFTIPSRIQNKQLIEVNRKWSFMYNKNNLRAKNISGDEERSRRISDSYLIEEKPRVSKHHVHFPSGNPVSAVYNLRTYATASKLERSNRIWEIEARSRYFDRLKYLISEGYEPEIASQLAASDADDDKPISVTDSSAKKLNDLQLTTEPSKHPKTRRRKRHRKSRVNQVTAHPPHMHEPTASSLLANKTNCNHQKFVSLEPGLLH
ncbi:unnamed protein product [Heterobilharzia americana]|nr:unnamed protein product [Heterobilharzia americana]